MRPGFVAPLLVLAGLVAARRFLDVVEVRGRSMAPALVPGDRLLVARSRPRVGDVVLAADPRAPGRELVKRVMAVDGGRVMLHGDNAAASTDSRSFGAVTDVEWRAVLRYWPPARIGVIPASEPHLTPVDEGGEPACTVPEALIAGD